jgi:isoamylase
MPIGSDNKSTTPNSGRSSAKQTLSTTGRSAPLGASVEQGCVNFSVYSRDASRIDLLLFDSEDAPPSRVIHLHPSDNRTYHYWHVSVPGLQPGQLYGYRAHGPFDPSQGLRFDASKVLLDPYGRGVVTPVGYSRDDAARNGYDNAATAMKSVVVDPHAYNWEGDVPLHRLSSHTVIYEMHVGDLPVTPTPGYPLTSAARSQASSKKYPICETWGLRQWNYCRFFSSMRKTARRAA